MTWSKATAILSLAAAALALAGWIRSENAARALTLRLDQQRIEISDLRARADKSERWAAITQGVMSFQQGAQPRPVAGAGASGAPQQTVAASAEPGRRPAALSKLLSDSKITDAQWHAVQAANEEARADIWAAAHELVDAPPEEAARKLDEIDARRVAAQRDVLNGAQMKAYEDFRAQAGIAAQIMCAKGAVKRLIPLY